MSLCKSLSNEGELELVNILLKHKSRYVLPLVPAPKFSERSQFLPLIDCVLRLNGFAHFSPVTPVTMALLNDGLEIDSFLNSMGLLLISKKKNFTIKIVQELLKFDIERCKQISQTQTQKSKM